MPWRANGSSRAPWGDRPRGHLFWRWILNNSVSFSAANKEFNAGRYTPALNILNQLVDVQQDAKTYGLLAKTLLKLGFNGAAASAFEIASRYESPRSLEYLRKAINLYHENGEDDLALLHGLRALVKSPKDADIVYVVASIYLQRDQQDIIRPFVSILIDSDNPQHHKLVSFYLSNKWRDKSNHELAQKIFKKYPNNFYYRFLFLSYAREYCNFKLVDQHFQRIADTLALGDYRFLQTEISFYNLHWSGNEEINRYATAGIPPMPQGATERRRSLTHQWPEKKIRIGYVSSDFWAGHATMKLLQSVLEMHDRSRFDVTLFCHTEPEELVKDRTDRSGWGNIVPIFDLTNDEAAALIRQHEIDVLIDLKGHTRATRTLLFNLPCAPIHAGWLGYPGSTVNVDLDYVIGDHFILPDSSKPFYHEKICRLPECYQPNDPVRRPLPRVVRRSQLDLPEDQFVFASFNNNRKITPETIDIWFRILKRAPESVLWIILSDEEARENILARAKLAGIGPKRIVFTGGLRYDLHIDRITGADLALDTFPVNGHTTTSDQLWAGLPVLTVKGTNLASRVSESLLNAIGVPELVAADPQNYEDMAVELYENREKLQGYRQRLIDNRFTHPLFDAERFTRHIETAYEMMVDRAKAGLEPDHFDVPALPARTAPFHGYSEAAE
jgi:predicted O-linked N-acetylglucosamine transferase (SPINDLY family)